MRVVVVGASGNVGTAPLRRLSGDAETEIVGVSRRRPALRPRATMPGRLAAIARGRLPGYGTRY